MNEEHSGLSHDLPEYVPNWPQPVKIRAKVYKLNAGWGWGHNCPHKPGHTVGFAQPTQPEAFAAALRHVRGCW